MGPRTSAAKPASKPTYAAMITQSVAELKERSGSSVSAITKSITVNHGTVNKPALSAALKKMVENGTLTKIKASYKLTKPVPAKKKAAPVKKTASRTKAATKPRKTIMKKKPVTKATPTKKATTKKTTTKKPTTTKKVAPAAKKKATAKTKTTTTKKTRASK